MACLSTLAARAAWCRRKPETEPVSRAVTPFVLEVCGLGLSGLRAEPRTGSALATILALPGGGYGSGYWHHPLALDASLLTLGATLGYRVVAIDRPGYLASARAGYDGMLLADQAELLATALNSLAAAPGCDRVTFLVGHSMGGILALMIAALGRTPSLLGVDVSGVPYRFSNDLAGAVAHELGEGSGSTKASAARLFYGPSGTFRDGLLRGRDVAAHPLPLVELRDAFDWPERFPRVAGAITAPVQFSLGEHDLTTPADPDTLRDVAKLFTASPRVDTHHQRGAGHNVSLHHVGRAYHLRALAFFDEILASRPES